VSGPPWYLVIASFAWMLLIHFTLGTNVGSFVGALVGLWFATRIVEART
jgi:hypothetical protein